MCQSNFTDILVILVSWFSISVSLSRINYKLINERQTSADHFCCVYFHSAHSLSKTTVCQSPLLFAARCSGGEEENFRLIVFCSSNTNPSRLRDNAWSVTSSFPKNTVFDIYTTPDRVAFSNFPTLDPIFQKCEVLVS